MTLHVTNNTTAKHSSKGFAISSRNELPLIASNSDYLVDAKSLHSRLKIKTRFNDWFERQVKSYNFKLGEDFYSNLSNQKFIGKGGDRKSKNIHLTIDMAKELCMVERSEIGRAFRRYFIEAEKELRTKRIYAAQATITEVSKTVKPLTLNGRKLYELRKVRQVLGFSTKSSTSNVRRSGYDGLLVVFDGTAYVAEEYLKVLMSSAKTRALRAEAKSAQPVLPENFGQLPLLKGGRA